VIDELAALVLGAVRRHDGRPLVAIAGSVAVGKSTVAAALAERLRAEGVTLTVVGTDGFLHPNRVLEPMGLVYDKGFPATYDWEALRGFLVAARLAESMVTVPQYSHRIFDIEGTIDLALGDAVLMEGINTLQEPVAELFDLRIFLEADPTAIRTWYVDRFLGLIEQAESDPSSFYARFVSQSSAERTATAGEVWDTINLANFNAHIAPSIAAADVVVRFDADHRITAILDHRLSSQR
jgi:type I pantothenate kinase